MDRKINLGILVNNIVGESQFLAEHGLSILIQIQEGEKKEDYLFDCGKSSSTLLHNISAYGIEMKNLSLKTIILSHGHYDHTGGLKGFLENTSQRIPVIGHPDVFSQRISYVGGFRTISCPFNQSEIREAGGDLLLTRDSVKINDYFMITGEVPRKNKYEKNPHFRKVINNRWLNDEVDDDLSIIID
ncbi:MAG TPA: MBL fold metallo-hydrolase, partial [Candidatus Atribacteria bacterium]|nr:MBL fold metallo-hydrolase [Candidatus Atribacteria bacterium]